MFDTSWIADLDAGSACEAIVATQTELRERELRELVLAAQWVKIHNADTLPNQTTGRVPPGTERAKQLGGDGTPPVAEFACAELGMLMGTGFITAENLMRDVLDLEHRHPLMWQALHAGEARVWKARKVTHLVHAAGLSHEQAHRVDAHVTPYVDTLSWSAFLDLVEAKIIEADPEAAEARRLAAAMGQFVATGQSNEFGLKTLIARANAGDVIFLVGMCDRIAQILLLKGDTAPVGVRRVRALGILANPAQALALLQEFAEVVPEGQDPDTPVAETGMDPEVEQEPVNEGDLHPSQNDADDPELCPTCLGRPVPDPRPMNVDPDKLRPRAVLHVRTSEEALRAGTGVAYCENGVGLITVEQMKEFLGHCAVTVKPMLDLRDQIPVDAYEVPTAMRESLRLSRPASVFPYSHTRSRNPDFDHTVPFVPVGLGGPPGQTRVENLGPMVRFGHRVKTHGRGWRHRQPSPGVYLWRTPHGYWFRVDHDGTHALGRDPDRTAANPTASSASASTTPLERAFADLIAAS